MDKERILTRIRDMKMNSVEKIAWSGNNNSTWMTPDIPTIVEMLINMGDVIDSIGGSLVFINDVEDLKCLKS